jgi:hypothetical protein
MSDRIIYVLCYDDESEQRAHTDFSKYVWARIYRIKNQSHLFEGVMYQSELLGLYDEWKDKKFVGTISYKLKERFNYMWHLSFDSIVSRIENTSNEMYDFVGLIQPIHGAELHVIGNRYPLLNTIFRDVCAACNIPTSRDNKMLFGRNRNYNILTSGFVFFNHWMSSPKWMLTYINYFNSVWLPAVESHPYIWQNSGYPGMSPEKLLQLTKRVDFYPYHPFINERFTSLFFYYTSARLLV